MRSQFNTLQSQIWSDVETCAEPLLYVRLNRAKQVSDAISFKTRGTASFDTYFNLFNIGKWQLHCSLKTLHLALTGLGKFKLQVLCSDPINGENILLDCDISLSENNPVRLQIPLLKGKPTKGVLFFRLTAKSAARLHRVDWQTKQTPLRNPDLVLAITTFERVAAIKNTVARFEQYIKTLDYRDQIRLVVVDNGQNANLENTANTQIIPNKNLGGSGGFARGLIKARRLKASHCLFMDDDVSIPMGSIERTYQMLAYATDPATAIAGALADGDDCAKLWENGALFNGTCHGLYRGLDLRNADAVIDMEQKTIASPAPDTPEKIYGGWWYFAFALDQVKHLPFPFFVRGDDVSFSLVHNFKIITLPGVMSFQDSNFSDKESPLTLYLDLRSHLAHQLSLPVLDHGRWQVAKIASWFVLRALIRCHYDSAAALNMALADLRRGPDFFAQHADMAKRRADIKALTKTEVWRDIQQLPDDQIRFNPQSRLSRLLMIIALNGLLLPGFSRYGNRITLSGQKRKKLGAILGAARITHLDKSARTAYTVTHSKMRSLTEGFKMLRHVALIIWHYPRLKLDWQTGYKKLTENETFWLEKLKQS